jgi:hypothetical protein
MPKGTDDDYTPEVATRPENARSAEVSSTEFSARAGTPDNCRILADKGGGFQPAAQRLDSNSWTSTLFR